MSCFSRTCSDRKRTSRRGSCAEFVTSLGYVRRIGRMVRYAPEDLACFIDNYRDHPYR